MRDVESYLPREERKLGESADSKLKGIENKSFRIKKFQLWLLLTKFQKKNQVLFSVDCVPLPISLARKMSRRIHSLISDLNRKEKDKKKEDYRVSLTEEPSDKKKKKSVELPTMSERNAKSMIEPKPERSSSCMMQEYSSDFSSECLSSHSEKRIKKRTHW